MVIDFLNRTYHPQTKGTHKGMRRAGVQKTLLIYPMKVGVIIKMAKAEILLFDC